LESIIRYDIIAHFKINDLVSNKQFGFLSGRSTVIELLNITDIWSDYIDKRGLVGVILILKRRLIKFHIKDLSENWNLT
jgi:hypothetical protein